MSMNLPWYRAWGGRTHSGGLCPCGRLSGALYQSPARQLSSFRGAPRIQLLQAPREGLGNKQHPVS